MSIYPPWLEGVLARQDAELMEIRPDKKRRNLENIKHMHFCYVAGQRAGIGILKILLSDFPCLLRRHLSDTVRFDPQTLELKKCFSFSHEIRSAADRVMEFLQQSLSFTSFHLNLSAEEISPAEAILSVPDDQNRADLFFLGILHTLELAMNRLAENLHHTSVHMHLAPEDDTPIARQRPRIVRGLNYLFLTLGVLANPENRPYDVLERGPEHFAPVDEYDSACAHVLGAIGHSISKAHAAASHTGPSASAFRHY